MAGQARRRAAGTTVGPMAGCRGRREGRERWIIPVAAPILRMNTDEVGDDITSFGRGVPIQGFHGGCQGGMQPQMQAGMQQGMQAGMQAGMQQGMQVGMMPHMQATMQPVMQPMMQARMQPSPQMYPLLQGGWTAQIPGVVPPVDSVEPSVTKESEGDGEGGSLVGGRQRKGGKGRSKGSNFTPMEDVWLVKSWLEVSLDPIVNTGQKREGFWSRIISQYNKKRGSFQERSVRSLQGRWETINKESTKFSGYMANVTRDNPSGKSDADKTSLALANFSRVEQYPYSLMHCWDLLKDEAKWMELGTRGSRDGDDSAIGDLLPTGATNLDNDPDTPTSHASGSKRPMGRDAAKRAAKKSNSESPSDSSQYVSKLHDMHLEKLAVLREENEKRLFRQEQQAVLDAQRYDEVKSQNQELIAHNQKMMAIKEAKLQLARKEDERKQTHEEERSLAIDLDTCPRRLRKYYAKKQQDILQRQGINDDDNDDP